MQCRAASRPVLWVRVKRGAAASVIAPVNKTSLAGQEREPVYGGSGHLRFPIRFSDKS